MSTQESSDDAPTATNDFLFVGGDPSIDLVNTEMMVSGELVDRIDSPSRLAAWLAESELGDLLGEATAEDLDIPRPVFAEVVALRGALRAGFDEIAGGRGLPASTLEAINAALREGPGSRLQVGTLGRLERVNRVDILEQPAWLPWLIADAAADLLSSPAADLLRRCAGQVCVLFFVDTSRNHSRRWCSMELCGNRSKVSAHHHRTRIAPER
jgi:predicted RNA-binding Zn ribbon-like protein